MLLRRVKDEGMSERESGRMERDNASDKQDGDTSRCSENKRAYLNRKCVILSKLPNIFWRPT